MGISDNLLALLLEECAQTAAFLYVHIYVQTQNVE